MSARLFPASVRPDVPPRSTRLLPKVAAAASALLVLAGCALTPVSANERSAPVPVPTASVPASASPSASASATATGTASQAPSASPSATTSASPSPTKTAPPDPLAALSSKQRKKFEPCLKRTLGAGSSGDCSALLLKELKAAGFYPWRLGRWVGVSGTNAILNYQRSRGIQADGWVGKQTWVALATDAPAAPKVLPDKCRTKGVVICVDQGHRTLYWLRNGEVKRTFKVRVGGYAQHAKTKIWRNFPTLNGTWRVYNKHVNPPSENYGSGAMPYSTMFHPDMYVHYSPGFNSSGYASSSHGCVNIRKIADARWIMRNTPIGAKVHIFTPTATA